ncbi:hypothetical protein QX776_00970 [Alteromonadaceae bacterium BrNp21-10]|nr:hypothetical protein [Alteromonadaceae bacterium BrNp21-10]
MKLTLQTDVYADYQCLLNNRAIMDIRDYKSACSRRDVVEVVLIQQALLLGGFLPPIKFIPGEYGLRYKGLLSAGKVLFSADTFWLSETKQDKDIYVSDVMIRRGEYTAGVYTASDNQKVLAVRSLDELQQLTGISSRNWLVDWRVLERMQLKQLIHEPVWSAQVQMIKHQFADFMLAPFLDRPDLSYHLKEFTLVPVPGIAVELDDSRHFVVSKKHPLGKQAITALNKGITILRSQGLIHKAYSDSGLFYPIEQKWTILNPSYH